MPLQPRLSQGFCGFLFPSSIRLLNLPCIDFTSDVTLDLERWGNYIFGKRREREVYTFDHFKAISFSVSSSLSNTFVKDEEIGKDRDEIETTYPFSLFCLAVLPKILNTAFLTSLLLAASSKPRKSSEGTFLPSTLLTRFDVCCGSRIAIAIREERVESPWTRNEAKRGSRA